MVSRSATVRPPPAPPMSRRSGARRGPRDGARRPDELALLDRFDDAGHGRRLSWTSAQFLTFIHDAEAGVQRQGAVRGAGPLAILALVFVGGLALNLTPCVLPMIPINLAIIGAGAQAAPAAAAAFCWARPTAAPWRSSTACWAWSSS